LHPVETVHTKYFEKNIIHIANLFSHKKYIDYRDKQEELS